MVDQEKDQTIGFEIGQHMKHKEYATWDESILWYGKKYIYYALLTNS
jgi:hypothetical protein